MTTNSFQNLRKIVSISEKFKTVNANKFLDKIDELRQHAKLEEWTLEYQIQNFNQE